MGCIWDYLGVIILHTECLKIHLQFNLSLCRDFRMIIIRSFQEAIRLSESCAQNAERMPRDSHDGLKEILLSSVES